jgi:purine-binding chemotaxis protein CheW
VKLHVAFSVDGVEYALPVAFVLQMEEFTGATAVPGTPDYVLGVVTVRGRVVPVIDLRRRFGLPSAQPTLDTRIVIVHAEGRVVALCVDKAREVVNLDEAQRQPAPDLVSQRSAGLVNGMQALGCRLFLLLDLARVLGENSHDHESPALLAAAPHERPALPG